MTGHGLYLSSEDVVPYGWATGDGHLAHHCPPARRAQATDPIYQLEQVRRSLQRAGYSGACVVEQVADALQELMFWREGEVNHG